MADEGLNRTFAGLLSDLEDEEVRLTGRQSELSKELREVEAELDRIAAVKRAIHGKTPPTSRPPKAKGRARGQLADEFVAGLASGGTFTARELADHLDADGRGVGPIVSRLVREGTITVVEGEESSTGYRVYRRA